MEFKNWPTSIINYFWIHKYIAKHNVFMGMIISKFRIVPFSSTEGTGYLRGMHKDLQKCL